MTDLRTLTLFSPIVALAGAAPPAGFTAQKLYNVVSIAVDNAAAPPVIYVLLIDDTGALHPIVANAGFTYAVTNVAKLS